MQGCRQRLHGRIKHPLFTSPPARVFLGKGKQPTPRLPAGRVKSPGGMGQGAAERRMSPPFP